MSPSISLSREDYQQLVKDSTKLQSVKDILTSDIITVPNATIGVLRIILGLEEGVSNEEVTDRANKRTNNHSKHGKCEDC